MEKHRRVSFNILKKNTKSILQSLQDSNNNLIIDLRELLEGISGIHDEDLERIETVDHLWKFLVSKNLITMDDVQILKDIARFVKSSELKNEVESYEHESCVPDTAQKVGHLETCLQVVKGGAKQAVILLKAGFKTAVQAAAITGTVAVIMKLFHNDPDALRNLLQDILPYGMNLIGLEKGSLYFALQASSLSSLKQLWTSYRDSSLKGKLKKVINEIDEVRKLAQGTEIDVTVEIDEEEYREACWVLLLAQTEQAEVEQSSKSVQRLRRHSLPCELDFLPMHDKRALKEAENKVSNKTRQRIHVAKQVEESSKEMEVLNGFKDTIKYEKDKTYLIQRNIEKLKQEIEDSEELLKTAVEVNDQNRVGSAYSKTGVLYYALGTLYKKTSKKENYEDTMKKAESCFREAAVSWEKLNAQLHDEDALKSEVNCSLFTTYGFLTTVLIATQQTEEALVISERTRDPGLVNMMIKKFQMNEKEILNDLMRYANVSSILENKNFSILIFANRQTIVSWTLEYQKPSFFLESEQKREDTYIINLLAALHGTSHQVQETLEKLYKLLIAPVLPKLTQDEVVIIADGPLQLVPYAALQNPMTGQFLSDIKSIRYAPSLTAMKIWQECPVDYHGNTGALIVGDPDVGKVNFEGEECNFPQSQFVLREAMVVGVILNASPLVGPQATKSEVLKRLQDHLSVIHIAAMGNERGDILLAPSASASRVIPEEEDYLLTIEEVQEMHIQAQLVVLSFSGSGCSNIKVGKVDCMSRAFLAAGARAVVASLWSIDEAATWSFMVNFYMYLKIGESASKSLQKAMKVLREEGFDEPKYWAPFFLIGDDVTISEK